MLELIDTLKFGIMPGIILAIYLISVKIIDNKRESSQVKITNQLIEVMININNFVINVTKTVIDNDKDKCEIAVRDALNSTSLHIAEFVINTLINNHIDNNKENITSNIHNIIQAEYYNLYRTLGLYTINNTNISSILKQDWINETEHIVVDIVYNEKLNKDIKIITMLNRLNSLFNTYVTYVKNNGIN
jgi:hypothetical protein